MKEHFEKGVDDDDDNIGDDDGTTEESNLCGIFKTKINQVLAT